MLVVTILLVVFLVSVNLLNYYLSRRDNLSALDKIVSQNLRSIPGSLPGGDMESDGREKELPGTPEKVPEGTLEKVPEGTPEKAPEGTPEKAPEGTLAEGSGKDPLEPPSGSEGGEKPAPESGKYFVARIAPSGAVEFYDLTHDADVGFEEMIRLINAAAVPFSPEVSGETETEKAVRPDLRTENDFGPNPVTGMEAAPSGPLRERGNVEGYLYYARQQADGSVSYAFLDISQETASIIRIILITAVLGTVLWLLILLLVIFLSRKAIAPVAESIEKQRQFITDAGHELKTPLAVIVSNVDVQELHGGKTKWLDNIRAQALRLSDLTKQMLALAKMEETETVAFTSTVFDASRVLEETVCIFRESASLRGIHIETDIEPEVKLYFSREQYQQMLELLLDNAVKYGRENGFLRVKLRSDRRAVRISLKNNCDSLPEVDPDQLFDRFYRADTSRSRQTGGSGIGLAVVRAIAQQGGGDARAVFHSDQVIEFQVDLQKGRKR